MEGEETALQETQPQKSVEQSAAGLVTHRIMDTLLVKLAQCGQHTQLSYRVWGTVPEER